MMDFEKYIIDNREKFDLEEPSEGHFKKFLEMQKTLPGNSNAGFSWKVALQAAAIALLVIMSSLWVFDRISGDPAAGVMITLGDINPEYREAELFYTAMINKRYNEIMSFDFRNNESEQQMIVTELAEMDKVYRTLEKELNEAGGNELVINAMIRHYQIKLEIMNRILEQLYQVKSIEMQKTEDDEKISI